MLPAQRKTEPRREAAAPGQRTRGPRVACSRYPPHSATRARLAEALRPSGRVPQWDGGGEAMEHVVRLLFWRFRNSHGAGGDAESPARQ